MQYEYKHTYESLGGIIMIHATTMSSIGFNQFSVVPFTGTRMFSIAIIGDNTVQVSKEFTYDEISGFLKVVNSMEPDGKYVPMLSITDMVLAKKEAEEREREEERKHRESMGIPSKGYNSIAAALIAAGWDLEG